MSLRRKTKGAVRFFGLRFFSLVFAAMFQFVFFHEGVEKNSMPKSLWRMHKRTACYRNVFVINVVKILSKSYGGSDYYSDLKPNCEAVPYFMKKMQLQKES